MERSVKFWYASVAIVVCSNAAIALAVWNATDEPVAVVESTPSPTEKPVGPFAQQTSGSSATTVVRPLTTLVLPLSPKGTTQPRATTSVFVPPVDPSSTLDGDLLILVLDTKALRNREVRDSWRDQLRTAPMEPVLRGRLLGGQIWVLARGDREPRRWTSVADFPPEPADPFANEDVEGVFRHARDAITKLRTRAKTEAVSVFVLWTSDKIPDACVKDPVAHRVGPLDERCRLLWHGTEWNRDTNRGEQLDAIFPRVIRLGTKPAGLAEAIRVELQR